MLCHIELFSPNDNNYTRLWYCHEELWRHQNLAMADKPSLRRTCLYFPRIPLLAATICNFALKIMIIYHEYSNALQALFSLYDSVLTHRGRVPPGNWKPFCLSPNELNWKLIYDLWRKYLHMNIPLYEYVNLVTEIVPYTIFYCNRIVLIFPITDLSDHTNDETAKINAWINANIYHWMLIKLTSCSSHQEIHLDVLMTLLQMESV